MSKNKTGPQNWQFESALLVLEFQMPHFGSNIHNKHVWRLRMFILLKIVHHKGAIFGGKLNLVTLHKVKWKENGTILKNHNETVHKGSF